MTVEEVKLLIAQGEGYNLEFKRSLPSKASELAEEICAFANAAGGTLLIGIDDKGFIHGISIDNNHRSRLQNILNCIEPKVDIVSEEINIDGKTILSLRCPSGKERPYTVSGSIIVRNGPNSEKITSVQRMRDFFQHSDRIFFDEGTCKQFKYPEDFDKKFFKEFMSVAGISEVLDEEIILSNLQLKAGNGHFKNGTVLFFGNDPQRFYPQSITRCLLFKGTNKTYILDDKIFTGNLLQQYNGALAYLRQKLNLNYIIEGTGPRKEVLEIPEDIFKECLLNALAHRDYYEKGAVTHVEIFDDRIDITNPGGLVHSISKEEFGTKSLSRNPLIFGLFLRMNMVEKIGSGINRMKEGMSQANLPEPYFGLDGFFTARFFRPVDFDKWIASIKDKLSDKQYYILQRLNNFPDSTIKIIAEVLGTSTRTVERHITVLKRFGLLERIGSDKDGYYQIHKISL
ncbi:RNA-binding domain-containing protein [Arachidicoccus soli]|nr:RNA-binding domain-containing protein [Arachidicoccus soli]